MPLQVLYAKALVCRDRCGMRGLGAVLRMVGESMSNSLALLANHPLVLLNMPHYDTERWQCARYLHHLQTQRQAELSRTDILDAIERCRCHPGDVGKELAE